jgi:hypothetical protein
MSVRPVREAKEAKAFDLRSGQAYYRLFLYRLSQYSISSITRVSRTVSLYVHRAEQSPSRTKRKSSLRRGQARLAQIQVSMQFKFNAIFSPPTRISLLITTSTRSW